MLMMVILTITNILTMIRVIGGNSNLKQQSFAES